MNAINPTFSFALSPQPYNVRLTFEAARLYAVHGQVVTDEGGNLRYRRPVRVNAHAVALLECRADGADALSVEALRVRGACTDAELKAVAARLVQPQVDLRAFYAVAEREPVMLETVRGLFGLRVVGFESLFSALVVTTIEQQIALKSAQNGERWLLSRFGAPITHKGTTYHAFPSPERLTALTAEDLRPLKITFIRINRILALARAVASGELDLEAIAALPPDEAYACLREIKGVGHWTAAWVMLRAMGVCLPPTSSDVALRSAVNHYVYGQPGRCDPAKTDAYLGQFAPHDGWASFYLLTRYAINRY